MIKGEMSFLKSFGKKMLAREQQFLAHFAENGLHNKRRKRDNCWPRKDFAQRLHKSLVSNGVRRSTINGAMNGLVSQGEFVNPKQVVTLDPAPPLLAITNRPAKPKLERQQQRLQRAAGRMKDKSGTNPANTHAFLFQRLRSGFPLLANISQKSAAGKGLFRKLFVLAIAIISHGRSADENLRLMLEMRKYFDKKLSIIGTARKDLLLLRCSPSSLDRFAGKM